MHYNNLSAAPAGFLARRGAPLLMCLAALGLTALLTGALHLRASVGEERIQRQALPVTAVTFEQRAGYERSESFLGLARAARTSDLGFELAGTLVELSAHEGLFVQGGAVLARLDIAQLKVRRVATAAEVERVSAQLELAELRADRQHNLARTGAVSQQAGDETRLTARALAAQLRGVEAQLRSLDIDLEKSELRAPYDGVIAVRHVNAGGVIGAGEPVLRLVAAGDREAHIGIAVEKAAQLVAGQHYTLEVRGRQTEARLRSVRPDVDPLTLTTIAVFELPPGMTALDGEPILLWLSETVDETGGWLPVSALLEGERGLWTVLSLHSENGATVSRRQHVEVLYLQGDRAFVRGAIPDRQRVVADGLHRIAPGAVVLPQEL